MNKVDKSSPIPLYIQVEEILKEMLFSKEYSNNFLPNEYELMNMLSVSRDTLRKAMKNLEIQGLIERIRGKGTRLNQKPEKINTTLSEWYSFTDEMSKKNQNLFYKYSIVEYCEAPEEVQNLFLSDQKVVKLIRAKGFKNPDVYFISYFNPIFLLEEDKDFMNGNFEKLYEYLEKKHNIIPEFSYEEISATMPDGDISKKLCIVDKNIPILCRKRKVYTLDNILIEYNLGFYRADKFTYNITLKNKIEE